MKKIKLILFSILAIIIIACGQNSTNPKDKADKTDNEVQGAIRKDGDIRTFSLTEVSPKIAELKDYKYKIVVLGDGFLEEDNVKDGTFDKGVENVMKKMFTVEPFKTYSAHFKIIKIYANSIVRTTDNPENNKKTVFGSRYIRDRLLVPQYTAKIDEYIARSGVKEDMILILANDTDTTRYGGSGGKYVTASMHSVAADIGIHEMAHGFGLGDEYTFGADPKDYPMSQIYKYPNLDTTDDTNKIKWKHLLNVEGHIETGLFKEEAYRGGYYRDNTNSDIVFRPSQTSIMNTRWGEITGQPTFFYFNTPSREAIVKVLYNKAGIIYSVDKFFKYDKPHSQSK